MNIALRSIVLIAFGLALPAIAADKSMVTSTNTDHVLIKPRQIAKDGEVLSDSKGRVYHIFEHPETGLGVVRIFDSLSIDEEKNTKPFRAADSVDTSGRAPRCSLVPIYCEAPQYRPDGTTYWLKFICGWRQSGTCN